MLRWLLFFCLCGFSLAFSETPSPEELVEQAEGYLEVGDVDRAREIYESLLKGNLDQWQRALIRYNLGCLEMLEGNWTKAIEEYNELVSRKNLSPVILSRLKQNSALALLGQAEDFMQGYEDQEEMSPSQSVLPYALLQEALKDSQEAMDINCHLRKIYGYSSCAPSEDLQYIHRRIEQELAQILKKKAAYHLKHLPAYELILLLEEQEELMQKQLEKWPKKPSQHSLPPVSVFAQTFNQNTPLWMSLRLSLASYSEQDRKLFENAEKSFYEALQLLIQGSLDSALSSLLNSLKELKELYEAIPKPSPLITKMRKLIASIDDALDEHPLANLSIVKIEKEMQEFQSIIQSSELKMDLKTDLQHLMAEGIHKIQLTQEYLDTNKPYSAAIFLTALEQSLRRGLVWLTQPKAVLPADVLKNAIDEERHALDLSLLTDPLPSKEGISTDMQKLLFQTQQTTNRDASLFYKAVLDWQNKQYHLHPKCLQSPWEEVMPLFYEGYDASKDAETQLSVNPPQMVNAIDDQKEALRKWQMALSLILKEIPPEEESKSTSSSPSNQSTPLKPKSSDKLLQDLMDMELDDRLPPSKQIKPKLVEKPW